MKLHSFSFLLIASAIIGCTGSGDTEDKSTAATAPLTLQQRLDTCPSDTDRFMVLGENVERLMYDGNKDSALYYLDLCRREAEKTHNINLLERADDVRMNVLMYTNDTTVEQQLVALANQRESTGRTRALGVAREILGAVYFRTEDFRKADSLIARAAMTARAEHDTTRWAGAVLGRIAITNKLNQSDTALALAELAMQLGPSSRDPAFTTSVYIEKANTLDLLGDADSSLALLNIAFELAHAQGDTLSMEQALMNKSEFLTKQGFHDASMDAVYHCRTLVDRFGPPNYYAPVNLALAVNLSALERKTEAMEAFQLAEQAARIYGAAAQWALAQAGRGRLQAELTNINAARSAMDSALADAHGTGSPKFMAEVELLYGEAERSAGNPDSAAAHADRAVSIFERIGDVTGTAAAQLTRSRIHGDRGDWSSANVLVHRSVQLARSARLRPLLTEGLGQSSLVRERLKDPAGALAAEREAGAIKDSLRNSGITRAIAEREARYGSDKRAYADSLAHAGELRERDLIATRAQLGESRANNRSLLIGSIALLLLGGGYALYRIRQQRVRSEAALAIAQANERLAQEKLRTSEFQNKALRAQMEPHFIRNTIGLAIARLRKKSESSVDDASELLASFSEWIDRVLVTSQHAAHALADELSALGNYLDLQRLRMNNTFNYTVYVDPAIDPRLAQVPPMLMQPLIENAIEYGLEPQDGKGHIRLSAERKEGGLLLSVEDDGVGRNHPKPERPRTRSASISTANIREQLAQLSERTGKRAEMRIIDLPKGTRVEVLLPI